MNVSEMRTMIAYNEWANKRLSAKVTRLTEDQLFIPEQVGPNSIYDALLHIIDGEYFWRLAIQTGVGPPQRIAKEELPDLGAVERFWEQEAGRLDDYVANLSDEDLRESFEFHWGTAKPRRRIRWQCLLHIVNHGTQHRGEIGLVLGGLGLSPGSLDLITYVTRQSVRSKLDK